MLFRSAADADREEARAGRLDERADAAAARFAERRVALAVDLLVAADVHRRQTDGYVAEANDRWQTEQEFGPEAVTDYPMPRIDTTEPVRAAMLALDLVAPAVSEAASELYLATVPLGPLATSAPNLPEDDPAGYRDWLQRRADALDRWDTARWAYVDAVQADLGTSRDGTA